MTEICKECRRPMGVESIEFCTGEWTVPCRVAAAGYRRGHADALVMAKDKAWPEMDCPNPYSDAEYPSIDWADVDEEAAKVAGEP